MRLITSAELSPPRRFRDERSISPPRSERPSNRFSYVSPSEEESWDERRHEVDRGQRHQHHRQHERDATRDLFEEQRLLNDGRPPAREATPPPRRASTSDSTFKTSPRFMFVG